MKKILVFGMTDNLGGVETVIMNYYRNIDKSKIQFDFLYNTEKIVYADEIKSLGGNTYKITPRAKGIIQYKADMKNFFKEHAREYSAIWVNLCILSNIDWLKYAKRYGIKCRIIHSHNSKNMTTKFKFLLHKINKKFLRLYATEYWACSEEAGKFFYGEHIRKGNKYKIINNAIDTKKYEFNQNEREIYRKKLNIENKLVIGHIGRFHFQKNHAFLIDIFTEINKQNKDTHLLLIGKGEDEQKIKEKVKERKLENNVSFLGSRNDIKQLFDAMDIFVLPSLFEGLGIVLIEAQSNGIDIYACKEGIPELVKLSNNFQFLSLKDTAQEWARVILKKKHDKRIDNSESLKKAGYDIYEESRKLESFFEKI